jgi:serine/threonine-protein kinase ATR
MSGLRHFNVSGLQGARDLLSRAAEIDQDVLDAIDLQLAETNSTQVAASSTARGNTWRAEIKDLLGEVLFPEKVQWMDDDDSMNDQEYKLRILSDIRDKYNGFVPLSIDSLTSKPFSSRPIVSPAAERVQLAAASVKLSCCLAHPGLTGCECVPEQLLSAFVASNLAMIGQLLEGNEGDVTPQVRKGAYEALTCAIKHVPSKSAIDALRPACEMVIAGMTDSDRNIRLSAG